MKTNVHLCANRGPLGKKIDVISKEAEATNCTLFEKVSLDTLRSKEPSYPDNRLLVTALYKHLCDDNVLKQLTVPRLNHIFT